MSDLLQRLTTRASQVMSFADLTAAVMPNGETIIDGPPQWADWAAEIAVAELSDVEVLKTVLEGMELWQSDSEASHYIHLMLADLPPPALESVPKMRDNITVWLINEVTYDLAIDLLLVTDDVFDGMLGEHLL